MDIEMPEVSGLDALVRIRKLYSVHANAADYGDVAK
jgi:CheY-like chemotaxis protein